MRCFASEIYDEGGEKRLSRERENERENERKIRNLWHQNNHIHESIRKQTHTYTYTQTNTHTHNSNREFCDVMLPKKDVTHKLSPPHRLCTTQERHNFRAQYPLRMKQLRLLSEREVRERDRKRSVRVNVECMCEC